jgi:polysaccharide biosynthesis transport protein
MYDAKLNTSLIKSSRDLTLRPVREVRESPQVSELTLRELFQMFRRRLRFIQIAACALLALGIIVCIFSTRRYEAQGTIQVEPESSGGLNRETLMGAMPVSSDALEQGITIQTQARILQSDELALRTIHALKLDQTTEFESRPGLFSWGNANSLPEAANLEKQAYALKVFRKNLAVEAIGGTRIIEMSFMNRDPLLAASIVNQLVRELVQFNFETGYKATEAASVALSKQLSDLRTQSEQLQARVADMQRESGIYSIGTTDIEGHQQSYSAVLERFQRASTTLSDAAQNRILKEAIYYAAQSGDAETLSSLAGNTLTGAAPSGITNSLSTIQNLRSQEGAAQAQLDQLKAKFNVSYPKITELQAGIDSMERSIGQEIKRVAERAKNDFKVADRTWRNALQNYNKEKVQADALNDKAIQYVITRQEADGSRTLYEDLLKRLKEAGIVQGLNANTISIIDQALAPIKPKRPNVPLYLAVALGLGLFVGGFGAVVIELVDDKVWDTDMIEQMGLPIIGLVPRYDQRREAMNGDNPYSTYREAIGGVRLALTRPMMGEAGRVILVTCATPDESKNELCMDLASSFAQVGKKVLLVESDMRHPALLRSLGLVPKEGLSRVLEGLNADRAILDHPAIPNLCVLPAGASPHDPSELVESPRMKMLVKEWRERFDVIVMSAPPVIRFTDARYLSELADLSVQVARYGISRRTSVHRAHNLLSSHSNGNVGIVFAGVPPNCSN